MVVDHWFRQIEKILESIKITSDATEIGLDAFQLEGESQVWWDWVKTSRVLKAMTWAELHELFMDKYFSATARNAMAQKFLELKQVMMTVMEYVAKFTKLSRFADDYVVTDIAKVRKFEIGLKLSIKGKNVGFLLQDMDSMVRTAMAIDKEIEDAWSIQDAGAGGNRKESQSSSSLGKKPKASSSRGFQGQGHDYQSQGQTRASN